MLAAAHGCAVRAFGFNRKSDFSRLRSKKSMCISKYSGAARGLTGLLLTLVSGAALADWKLNMPRGVTDISHEVYRLHMGVFWVCVIIGIIVFGAMIWSIIHHRKSKGVVPAKFHHNTVVEVIWTAIPFAILVGMAVPAARTLIKMEDMRAADLSIKVTGYQWKWRYDYLDQNFCFFSTLSRDSN